MSILINNCHKFTLISLTLVAIVSASYSVKCIPLESDSSTTTTSTTTSTTTTTPSSVTTNSYDQSNYYSKYQQLALRNLILPGLFPIPSMFVPNQAHQLIKPESQPQQQPRQFFLTQFDSSTNPSTITRTVLEPATTETPTTSTMSASSSNSGLETISMSHNSFNPNSIFKKFWQRQQRPEQLAFEKSLIPMPSLLEAKPVSRERFVKRIIYTSPTLSDTIEDLRPE